MMTAEPLAHGLQRRVVAPQRLDLPLPFFVRQVGQRIAVSLLTAQQRGTDLVLCGGNRLLAVVLARDAALGQGIHHPLGRHLRLLVAHSRLHRAAYILLALGDDILHPRLSPQDTLYPLGIAASDVTQLVGQPERRFVALSRLRRSVAYPGIHYLLDGHPAELAQFQILDVHYPISLSSWSALALRATSRGLTMTLTIQFAVLLFV